MKRFLAALTLTVLFCLGAITVLGDVAFGAIVGSRLQAENMTRSSTSQITIQSDPDGSGPAGSNLRWEAGSNTSVRASITITPNQQVNQIQTFVRQVGTNDAFAFYVDGVKVGTVTPPSGGAWGLRTIDLASPISPVAAGQQPHQLQIGPNATLANRANVDWFELHNTGSTGGDTTPPLAPNITTGPAAGSTDTDGNVSFTWTGAESGGTFECSNVPLGQAANYSSDPACTSPKPYSGLANGSYTFSVRQKDAAGNVGAAASRNYSVSRTLPPPTPSGFTPGVGTGTATECDVTVAASTSNTNLTNALNSVPANLGGNHYVICMRRGAHGNYISIKPSNTGDSASARLILKSYPGEQASLRGEIQPSSSYSYFTLRDFQVDGRFKRCFDGSIPNPNCGGDVTNQGNPNMRPSLRVSGNAMEIINMDIAGGNDLPNGVGNDLINRSTCIGYAQNPINSLIEHSWIHNCGLSAAVSVGEEDAHCIYTSNAGNGGIIRDNLIWDCAESGINGYGGSVGAKNMLFEKNIIWRGGPNMSIGGASSGNTVQNSLFLDPTNGKNLSGSAPSTVRHICLDSPINNSAVTVSDHVIVSPSQASVSGDPRTGNLTITAPSACLAKYTGTMLTPTV